MRICVIVTLGLFLSGCGSKPSAPQATAPAKAPPAVVASPPTPTAVPAPVHEIPKTTELKREPEIKWLPVNAVVKVGPIEASVENVSVGKVSFKSLTGDDAES